MSPPFCLHCLLVFHLRSADHRDEAFLFSVKTFYPLFRLESVSGVFGTDTGFARAEEYQGRLKWQSVKLACKACETNRRSLTVYHPARGSKLPRSLTPSAVSHTHGS
jgi:hypothetical protein